MDDIQFSCYMAPASQTQVPRELSTLASRPLSQPIFMPNLPTISPTPYTSTPKRPPSNLETVESSQIRDTSQGFNIKINPRGRTLDDEKLFVLFNCAIALQEEYNGGKKGFWEKVEARFTVEVGQSYSWKSCKEKISARVRARQAYLEKYATACQAESASTLESAIDDWIEFLNVYAEKPNGLSSQKPNNELRQLQSVLPRDGLLMTTEKNFKRRADLLMAASREDSGTRNSNSDTNSDSESLLIWEASRGRKNKRRKQAQDVFTKDDFFAFQRQIQEQDRLLVESLRGAQNEALQKRIEDMGRRISELETSMNQKLDLILEQLRKR